MQQAPIPSSRKALTSASAHLKINRMPLSGIFKLLRGSDLQHRAQGWRTLWERRDQIALGRREFADLDDLIGYEDDLALVSQAHAALSVLRKKGKPVLQDQFWERFDSAHTAMGGAVVLAACNEYSVPDAHSLITLAQYIPGARDIDFRTIPIQQPDWNDLPIAGMRAICLVGRPAYYRDFALVASFPPDLRFRFPAGDDKWRGQPISRASIKQYHHVEQWWNGQKTGVYKARETKGSAGSAGRRVDYAVAQRFSVMLGGQRIVVVLLAGATSLGTAGAVHWATHERVGKANFPGLDRYQDTITDTTCIEALLEVTDNVHTPRRPWGPRVHLKKLFLNGSANLVSSGPSVIRLVGGAGGAGGVTSVFFDDDGVRATGDEFAALVALCLKAGQSPDGIVSTRDLLHDLTVWPGARRIGNWTKPEQVRQYYLDAFQRRSLNGKLHVHEKNGLKLEPKIELT